MTDSSVNTRATTLLGKRPSRDLDATPHEVGCACPVHGRAKDAKSSCLRWSQLNHFVRCTQAKLDYPVMICIPNPARATRLFLNALEAASDKIDGARP